MSPAPGNPPPVQTGGGDTLQRQIDAIVGLPGTSDDIKKYLVSVWADRDKDQRGSRLENKRWWYNTPLAIALTGIITIAANFAVAWFLGQQQTSNAVTLEETKFEYEIVQQELAKEYSSDPDAQVKHACVLLFLSNSGVLHSLNSGALVDMATVALGDGKDKTVPCRDIPQLSPPSRDIPQLSPPTPTVSQPGGMPLERMPSQDMDSNFNKIEIPAGLKPIVASVADRIMAGRSRYEAVEKATSIPWPIIGIIHARESTLSWDVQLGSGDPWNKISTHVPAGRGPFKNWEESAIDALNFYNFTPPKSIGDALYQMEKLNGFGYRKKDINSPYVWAGSQFYSSGKYVADGHFDPDAVDHQLGVAVLLKYLMTDKGVTIAFAQAKSPN